jgi:hypothetical protein
LAQVIAKNKQRTWGLFARLTKARLVGVMVDAGKDDEARRVIDAKEADGAAQAARSLGKGWLPEPLRPIG